MVCKSMHQTISSTDDFTYISWAINWYFAFIELSRLQLNRVKWLIMQILHHSTCDWFRRCNQNAIPLIEMLNLEIFAKGIFSFKNWMFDSLSKIKSKYQSHFALFNIPPLNNFLLTRKSISWKKIFAIDNAYHFTRSSCVIFRWKPDR